MVEDAFGLIDLWVNDAMVTIYAEFLDIYPDEYRRATDVTYHGMVWDTRAALKRMLPRDLQELHREHPEAAFAPQ